MSLPVPGFRVIHDFSRRPLTWFHGTSEKRFHEILRGSGRLLTVKSESTVSHYNDRLVFVSFFSPMFAVAFEYALRRAKADDSVPVVLEVYKPEKNVMYEDKQDHRSALFSFDNVKVAAVRYCR